MHIPDGFLDLPLAAVFAVASLAVLSVAAYRAEETLEGVRVPMLGVTAAGIFAAQMLNWPIPGGTSAHFVGGGLAAILLGPHLGALAMATVVVIQALVFGDGGITALGANVFNMAVVHVYVGYVVFRALRRYDAVTAAFAAGWLGIAAAAVVAGVQVGLSGTFEYQVFQTVAIMGVGHVLLGLIEGGITAVVFRYVATARPDVVAEHHSQGARA